MNDIIDFLETEAELEAALYLLTQILEIPECRLYEHGFSDKYSPQVFVCMQTIIKCKRRLKKSVLKHDKELFEAAKIRLRKYIATVDRDEQIKILKYVQPD